MAPRRSLAVAAALALSVCSRGGGARDILDGEARVPDDAGIATALTFEAITLDGERTYEVSEDLIAFDTYNLQLEPVLRRRGQYVHVGLEGSTMVWMAGISAVVPADDRVSAYYTGVLTEVEGRRAFFRDGTVLELSDDIHSPEGGTVVEAEIDTASDRVIGLTSRG